MGAIFGGAVPLAGSAGAGARSVVRLARGEADELPAQLLRGVEADRAGIEGMRRTLGPDGMLVDTGPTMRGIAQGAAATPGEGRTRLVNTLAERERETVPRMTAGREAITGPAPTTREINEQITADMRAMDPEWRAAGRGARAVDTTPIAHDLDALIVDLRGPAQAELRNVRRSLNIEGTDQLDPSPHTLHQTRMAIDDVLYGGGPAAQPPPGVVRELSRVRARISQELHDNVPGMANLDARYAEFASRRSAFQRGQEVLDTSRESYTHPRDWARETTEMAAPKGGPRSTVAQPSAAPIYSRYGTANELDRMVGTGTDDLRVLERKFAPGNAAMQKLATQFGVQGADDFERMLRNNRTFRESYNKIVHGSKTAETLEAVADSARGGFPTPRFTPSGAYDMADAVVQRVRAGSSAAARNRIAEIMSLRGAELDEMIPRLLAASGNQARQDISRTMLENILRRSVAGEIGQRVGR
jgi:hypothetical protein